MKCIEKKMKTIHPMGCVAMTWEDAKLMAKRNERDCWSFNMAKCLHFLANHMDANQPPLDRRLTDDEIRERIREKEKIEWRLEDANYHTFCGLLHKGKYMEALKWIENTFADDDAE